MSEPLIKIMIPESCHRQVKSAAALQGVSIRDFVKDVLLGVVGSMDVLDRTKRRMLEKGIDGSTIGSAICAASQGYESTRRK